MSREQTDLLRIVSAVAIVFNHTMWDSYIQFPHTTESVIVSFFNQLGKGAVLFFVFLSGFAFTRHPELQGDRFSSASFFRNRFGRILPPYLLSSLLFFWWKGPDANLFLALILGSAHFHLYFLALVLYLYLLFPWLRQIPLRSAGAAWILILVLILKSLGLYLEEPGAAHFGWLHYFAYGIFFFQIGIWVGRGELQLDPGPVLTWSGLALSFALLWLDFNLRVHAGQDVDSAGRTWRPAVALFVLFSLAVFQSNWQLPQWKPLRQLARATFLVYVIHPFLMEATFQLEPIGRFVSVLSLAWIFALLGSAMARRSILAGLLLGEGDHWLTRPQSPRAD